MKGYAGPSNDTLVLGPFFQADYALLTIQGMTTAECAACVRKYLLSQGGIFSVEVWPKRGMVQVSFDHRMISAQRLTDGLPCNSCANRHTFCARLLVHEIHTYLKSSTAH